MTVDAMRLRDGTGNLLMNEYGEWVWDAGRSLSAVIIV